MAKPLFVFDGPRNAAITIAPAHGAGRRALCNAWFAGSGEPRNRRRATDSAITLFSFLLARREGKRLAADLRQSVLSGLLCCLCFGVAPGRMIFTPTDLRADLKTLFVIGTFHVEQ
jgi:hypothetical protein